MNADLVLRLTSRARLVFVSAKRRFKLLIVMFNILSLSDPYAEIRNKRKNKARAVRQWSWGGIGSLVHSLRLSED